MYFAPSGPVKRIEIARMRREYRENWRERPVHAEATVSYLNIVNFRWIWIRMAVS